MIFMEYLFLLSPEIERAGNVPALSIARSAIVICKQDRLVRLVAIS